MLAAKPSQTPHSFAICTLQGSLLTLAVLTLLAFTCLSLKSFSSLSLSSPSPPSEPVFDSQPKASSKQSIRRDNEQLEELPDPEVFHFPEVFRLNYAEMERRFKVYIYPDGDPNTYYQTPRKLTGKYASEGYFFQNIRGTSYENMTIIVEHYVQGLISKYPYWNRTFGADHFFVTCHDVGVRATEGLPFLVKNSIRVVCSPSYDVGFIPHKDVALPQVLQPFALPRGGGDVENRTILGYWAGHRNSKIRVILAQEWENDTELVVKNNRIIELPEPCCINRISTG